MDELIIVCVRGVKPWAICQPNKDKTDHVYYSIISRYKSYIEAVREIEKVKKYGAITLKPVIDEMCKVVGEGIKHGK